jgi:hypothetical protein
MTNTRITVVTLAFALLLTSGCVDTSLPGTDPISDIINTLDPTVQLDPVLESTAGAKAVALGDFNNDGLMDIVSISSENQPVQLHLQNPTTGRFDLLSIAGGGPLAKMIKVAAADFNGDGRLDIAVLVNDTGFAPPPDVEKPGALILLIQGNDPLDPSQWLMVYAPPSCHDNPDQPSCGLFFSGSATGVTDMVTGDFNRDGLPDIAVTSNEPLPNGADEQDPHTFVYVFLNPGAASSTNAGSWTRTIAFADVVDLTALAVADLDMDNDMDIILAASSAKTWNLSWLRNGGPNVPWTWSQVGQQDGGANAIATGDLNGDGYPDVVAVDTAQTLVQWFRNPGAAALSPAVRSVPWYVYNVGMPSEVLVDGEAQSVSLDQVQLVDVDRNGTLECFLSGSGIAYEYTRGENVFSPWNGRALFKTNPTGSIGTVAFYDFEGTSALDIIVPVDRGGLTLDGVYMFGR